MRKNLFGWLAVGTLTLGLGFAQPSAQLNTQPLSPDAKAAVLEALTAPRGEYAAYATYSAIVEKFGNIEPYLSIRASEERHILALQRLLTRYGISIPVNAYIGKINLGNDLIKIAGEEAQTEVDNVAMYDALSPKITAYPDIAMVFSNLRNASQFRHLPAFQAAARNGGKLDYGLPGMTEGRGQMGGGPAFGSGMGNGPARGSGQGYGPQGCPMGARVGGPSR